MKNHVRALVRRARWRWVERLKRRRRYGLRAAITLETFEARLLLTGDSPDAAVDQYDVSQDGVVSTIDALLVANTVVDDVDGTSDSASDYDVNQDGAVTQGDVAAIADHIDAQATNTSADAARPDNPSGDAGDSSGADASSGDDAAGGGDAAADDAVVGDASADTGTSLTADPAGGGGGGSAVSLSNGSGGVTTANDGACTSLGHRQVGDGWLTGTANADEFVMEFDHDGDGTPDGEAIARGDRSWSYIPLGLQVGSHTLHQRTRGWDYTTQQLVVGNWEEVQFDYLPPANDAPIISMFKLQTADGEGDDIPTSAYNLLVGKVTDDCQAVGVTVEFDHDGDGQPDGLAITDADGEFRYRPANLPLDNVTIAARPLQWDFSQEAYLVGEWVVLSFIYKEHVNEPPPIVKLAATEGPAPIVEGSINNEYSLANIDIEIDYDADQTADATTKTTTWGDFSFGVEGLPVGGHEIHVRACEFDHVGVQILCGGWKELDVKRTELETPDIPSIPAVPVPSTATPDPLISPTASSELRSLAASITSDWATVPTAVKSQVDAINKTYEDTKSYLDDRYDHDLATAEANRVSAINTANDAYGASVATADATYAAAVHTARENLVAGLSTSVNPSPSIDFEDSVWQEVPPSEALVIPPDHEQPKAPVSPSYDGPAYDFESDVVYQNRTKAAKDAHTAAVKAVNNAFKAAEKAAHDTFTAAKKAIEQAYKTAIDAADSAYDTAVAQPAPIDMDAEQAAHRNRTAAARQAYDARVQQIRDAFKAAADTEGQRHHDRLTVINADHTARVGAAQLLPSRAAQLAAIAASERTSATEMADENLLHANTMAPLIKNRDRDLAQALEVYRNAVHASERQLNDQRTLHDHFLDAKKVRAQFDLESAYAVARKTRDKAIAAAKQTRDKAIAAGKEAQTIALANADATLWREQADAKKDAMNAWTAVATPWIDYQAALASHEATYIHARATAFLTNATTTANATRREADTIADANKLHDDNVADADYTRAIDRAVATRDQDLGAADLARDRSFANARLWQGFQVGLAGSDRHYQYEMANDQETYDLDVAPEEHAATVAMGNANADYTLSDFTDWYSLAIADANVEHSLHTAISTYQNVLTNEQLLSGDQRTGDYMTWRWRYRKDVDQSEHNELAQLSALQHARDLTFAQTDRAYTVEIVGAHIARDDTAAGAEKDWWYTTANADHGYNYALANASHRRRNSDAASLRTFEMQVVADYDTEVNNWSSSLAPCSPAGGDHLCRSAWHRFQVGLAGAEVDRTDADTQAHVDHVSRTTDTDRDHALSIALADRNAAQRQADAVHQQIVSMNGALATHKSVIADGILVHGLQVAAVKTAHDLSVARANLALHNTEVWEDALLQAAIDRFDGQRLRDIADAKKILEHTRYTAGRDQSIEVANARQALESNAISFTAYEIRIDAAATAYNATMQVAEEAFRRVEEGALWQYRYDRGQHEQQTAIAVATAQEAATNSHGAHEYSLVAGQTSADRTLASVTRAAVHQLADSRHQFVKRYADEVAYTIKTQTKAHAQADAILSNELANASALYSRDLDRASSADREEVADVLGQYHIGMFTRHQGATAAAATGPLSVGLTADLLEFRDKAALGDFAHSLRLRPMRNDYHDALTAASTILTGETYTNNIFHVSAVAGTERTYTDAIADETESWSVSFDYALADRERTTQKADADRAQTRVNVESDYLVDKTDAQRDYDDTVASEYVTWVTRMSAAEAYKFLWKDYWFGVREAKHRTMTETADDDYSVAKLVAKTKFTDDIGTAQTKRASGLGQADTRHAADLSTAGTTYATAVNAAEYLYSLSNRNAAAGRITNLAGADRDLANGTARSNQTFVSAQGAADTSFQFDVGNSHVTRAADWADAERRYQRDWAQHTPTQMHNLSATRAAPYAGLQNALISAGRNWIGGVGPAMVDFARASAQATADFQYTVAQASELRNNEQSAADVQFTSSSEPLRESWRIDDVGSEQVYQIGLAGRENTRRGALAAEFGALIQTTADAEAKHARDSADAEHWYRTSMAAIAEQHETTRAAANATRLRAIEAAEGAYATAMANGANPQTAQQNYDRDLSAAQTAYDQQMSAADAVRDSFKEMTEQNYKVWKAQVELGRVTSVANGDQAWIDTNASENKLFAQREAQASKQLADQLAAHAKTFAIDVAAHEQIHDLAYDAAQVAFWTTEQASDADWNTTVASAQADLWDTQYRHQSLQGALPTDWLSYVGQLSQAKRDWWSSFRGTYEQWIADVNGINATYQDSVNTAFTTRGTAFAAADQTRTVAVAHAAERRAKALAQTQYDYVAAMWDPSERDLKDHALAERDRLVNIATVERDMAAGTMTATAGSAAIAAANAAHATLTKAATKAYEVAEVTANGLRKIGIAKVNESFVTDVASANQAWTNATEAAQMAYDVRVADAEFKRATDTATADAAYWFDEAATYHGQLSFSLRAWGVPSTPRHTHAIDMADAKERRVSGMSSSQAVRELALASAERNHRVAVAAARDRYFTDLAQATVDRDVDLAGADVTQAKIDALTKAKRYVDGQYKPMHPLFPEKPDQYPYLIDEVLAADYEVRAWELPGGLEPVKKLFHYRSRTERGQFEVREWLQPYRGNRINAKHIRATDSWAGYTLGTGSYGNADNYNVGPDNNNDDGKVEDQVVRLDLRTIDSLYVFPTYYEQLGELLGALSTEASDVWQRFRSIGLGDEHAFAAYGHPTSDAMRHLHNNTRPPQTESNSQGGAAADSASGTTGTGSGGTGSVNSGLVGGDSGSGSKQVRVAPEIVAKKSTTHAKRPRRPNGNRPASRANTTQTESSSLTSAEKKERIKQNVRSAFEEVVDAKQMNEFLRGVLQGFQDAFMDRIELLKSVVSLGNDAYVLGTIPAAHAAKIGISTGLTLDPSLHWLFRKTGQDKTLYALFWLHDQKVAAAAQRMEERLEAAQQLLERLKGVPEHAKLAAQYVQALSAEIITALGGAIPELTAARNGLATASVGLGDTLLPLLDVLIDQSGPLMQDLGLTLTEEVTAYQYGYVVGMLLYELVEFVAITAATAGWGTAIKGTTFLAELRTVIRTSFLLEADDFARLAAKRAGVDDLARMRRASPLERGGLSYEGRRWGDTPNYVRNHLKQPIGHKSSLEEIEDTLSKVGHGLEEAFIFDPETGTVTYRKTGTANSIDVPEAHARRKIVLHNHPSGGGPSFDDIWRLLADGALEERYVTSNYVYSIKNLGDADRRAALKKLRDHLARYEAVYNARIDALTKQIVGGSLIRTPEMAHEISLRAIQPLLDQLGLVLEVRRLIDD